jgi:CrcB protein
MATYLWVALGGALGSVARFALTTVVARRFGDAFPWGTLLVNVTGSLLIGILAAAGESTGKLSTSNVYRFWVVGVCGGYTTFSAFSMQTFSLARSGQPLAAGANVLLSVAVCLVAVWIGYWLASAIARQ